MANLIEFVTMDADEIRDDMVTQYEALTGVTLQPADPVMYLINWAASALEYEAGKINFAANMNIPQKSAGEYLDNLGELFREVERINGSYALCTMKFTLSASQLVAITIPKGTRISTADETLVFATTEALTIAAGSTNGTVAAQCTTTGANANGYAAGTINKLVDIFPYFGSCYNTDTTTGGADVETDSSLYERYRLSTGTWSTAGASAAYEYFAKSASADIADARAVCEVSTRSVTCTVYSGHCFVGGDQLKTSTLRVYAHGSTTPLTLNTNYTFTYTDGHLLNITLLGTYASASQMDIKIDEVNAGIVDLYILMSGGQLPNQAVLDLVEEAVSEAKNVRALTDKVVVQAPQTTDYTINLTYYISQENADNVSSIQSAVGEAVDAYIAWQYGEIGLDINPSELHKLVMEAGAKRVVITSPTYTVLDQRHIAHISSRTVTYGGLEEQ